MNVTLLMAITINGYIADLNDDTDWVKDLDALYEMIAHFGIVVMEKRTYDECRKFNAFPYKGATNIVMTHDAELIAQTTDTVVFTDKSPQQVIEMIKQRGSDSAGEV